MICPWLKRPLSVAACARWVVILLAAFAGLLVIGCSSTPFTLAASGPYVYPANWAYPADANPSLDRIAVLVTITNLSGDDLQINPADFLVRDSQHRVYPSNVTAMGPTITSANLPSETRGSLPLPTVTLRSNDVLSGFIVFDVPAGVRPVELIWRQSDTDSIVTLATTH